MKAISIREPWAWAILHCGKRIENRSTNVVGSYRGPVLIHAAKREADDWFGACELLRIHGFRPPALDHLHRGGIVGRARIAEVWSPTRGARNHGVEVWTPTRSDRNPDADPWWERDCFGIILVDVKPLPFVPWKGQLGLFNIDSGRLLGAYCRGGLFDVPDDYATRAT